MAKDSAELALVLGTRPEIIKLAPVVRACQDQGVPFSILHTGQHYSPELDAVFFRSLKLPQPDHNLNVGSLPHGAQTGKMLAGLEELFAKRRPHAVLVQGDTNSVLAGTLAAAKMNVPVGHVEAGLRSGDRTMPEETNRVVADHLSEWNFAPTKAAADNLRREGLERTAHVVGNTVVDAVQQNRGLADQGSTILKTLGLEPGRFIVLTAHRAENVDDPVRFRGILDGTAQAAKALGVEAVYPIHPRSRARLGSAGAPKGVRLVEPLDFLDFLRLTGSARLVVTDSGGLQEEACILGVPCVTVRDNTERPETIAAGANVLAGADPARIVAAAERMDKAKRSWAQPFGDGQAARRIVDIAAGAA